MGLWKKLNDWHDGKVKERADEKRVDSIKKSCGCACFCPKCKEPLNDTSKCEMLDDSGVYEYTCANCGFRSVFHFGVAPVPIYMQDFKK